MVLFMSRAKAKNGSRGRGASLRPQRVDALIVGGGMVGACLAAALGSAGLQVTVIDRSAVEDRLDRGYDGRASAIAQGSKRVLESIGVWDGMAAAAEPILDIRVSDGVSRLFLHYDHRDVGEGPLGYIVENLAIRDALYARLAALDTVAVRAPVSLEALEPGAGGTIAHLSDGTVVIAALVVAADGRRSALRRQAGIAVTEWSYPQTGIVCTMGHERPHGGVAHERFLPAGPFAVLPMTDDPEYGHRSSIVWTERNDLAPAMLALSNADFSAELGRRFGDWYGTVRVIGGRWSYPLSLLHAERYVGDRLALVGDAAHAMHPIAGQGLNLGIRGVAALAEALVDAARLGLDIGAPSVLERYQRWRRVDAVTLLAATDGLNRLFSNDVAPVRLARDLGLAAVNELPPLKRFFMRHAMGLIGELPRLARGERL
jgi:2-octaprenyl-6-methoxyphenol hydroxylase